MEKFDILVDVINSGLVNHPAYYDFIGQAGTTPLEYFEDFIKIENEALNDHKSSFK